MGSDYNWDLPSFDSGGGWTDTNNYDLGSSGAESSFGSGSSYSDNSSIPNFNDDSWYVDSTGGDVDTSMFDDIWGWVKSDQGVSVLGGAAKGLMSIWAADKANQLRKELAGAGGGSEAARLHDAQVARHNASINQPMDMGLIEYKRS